MNPIIEPIANLAINYLENNSLYLFNRAVEWASKHYYSFFSPHFYPFLDQTPINSREISKCNDHILPTDIVQIIMTSLKEDHKSLLAISEVCKRWKWLAQNIQLHGGITIGYKDLIKKTAIWILINKYLATDVHILMEKNGLCPSPIKMHEPLPLYLSRIKTLTVESEVGISENYNYTELVDQLLNLHEKLYNLESFCCELRYPHYYVNDDEFNFSSCIHLKSLFLNNIIPSKLNTPSSLITFSYAKSMSVKDDLDLSHCTQMQSLFADEIWNKIIAPKSLRELHYWDSVVPIDLSHTDLKVFKCSPRQCQKNSIHPSLPSCLESYTNTWVSTDTDLSNLTNLTSLCLPFVSKEASITFPENLSNLVHLEFKAENIHNPVVLQKLQVLRVEVDKKK